MFRALPPVGVPLSAADIMAGLHGMGNSSVLPRFREEICRKFGVRHCFLTSSGRAALSLLLTALHRLHPEKNEVAVPAYTSFSVPSAVVNARLRVSLYDIGEETLSPNMEGLKKIIGKRTLAVIVCHLYGYPADVEEVADFAHRKETSLIDDAAQAMGATLNGRWVGTLGTAGIFSLGRGKNISTINGGVIVTNDDELAKEIAAVPPDPVEKGEILNLCLNSFALLLLQRPCMYWIPRNFPFLKIGDSNFDPSFRRQALTAYQAAVGIRMLGRLGEMNRRRRERAEGVMSLLRASNKVTFPHSVAGGEPVYLRLPVVPTSKVKVAPELGIVRSYPLPLHRIQGLRSHISSSADLPVSERLAAMLLTMPTHDYVRSTDFKRMVQHIA